MSTTELNAQIDASARWPIFFYFKTGAFWLVLATILGLVNAFKLVFPDFLDGAAFLSYGRLQPAFLHIFLYGWVCSAAFAAILWVFARLTKVELALPSVVLVGAHVWHIGVLFGLIGILGGRLRPYEGFEMPAFAAAILAIGLLSVILSVAVMLARRSETSALYISAWFLLGALLWFAWSLVTSNVLLSSGKLPGVLQTVVAYWYSGSFFGLWLIPVGLGLLYYCIPLITGQPVARYSMSWIAFWGVALLGGLLGLRHLSGGPLPVWMITLSVSAGILILIPLAIAGGTLFPSLRGGESLMEESVPLRFLVFGLLALLGAAFFSAFSTQQGIAKFYQFTLGNDVYPLLSGYAFLSMILFGVAYLILPKLTGVAWANPGRIELHYWITLFSVLLLIIFTIAAGFSQGTSLADGRYSYEILIQGKFFLPFASIRVIFWLALLLANLLFLANLAQLLWDFFRPLSLIPFLLTPDKELEKSPAPAVSRA